MQVQRIMVTGVRKVALEAVDLVVEGLGPTEVVLETRVSLLSGGTEGAWFQGQQIPGRPPLEWPRPTGYAVVGEVIVAGDESGFVVGQTAYTMSPHASHHRLDTAQQMVLPVPDGLSAATAVFARLVAVPLVSVRTARARIGDRAAVVGLGLVGNLGAQVLQAAGLVTTGVDLVAARRALAERCGIATTVDPALAGAIQPVHRLVLEASGTARGALTAVELTQLGGEVSLVGTPWVPDPTLPASPFLEAIHTRYITIRSGWEWQLPRTAIADQAGAIHQPGSVPDGHRIAFELLQQGRVQVDTLLTDRVDPRNCQAAYERAVDRKSEALGIIFEWRA